MNDNQLLDQLDTAITTEELATKAVDNALVSMKDSFELVKENLLLKKTELDNIAIEELSTIISINDDKHLSDVRKTITSCNKSIKEVSEMRLNTTRPIDAFKKDLIAVEGNICNKLQSEIDRVKSLADNWELAEAKRRKDEQEKLQKEIDRNNELERISVALKSEAKIALDKLIYRVETELTDRFEDLTLENFENSISLLNGYKPVLREEIYNSLFSIPYNTNIITGTEYLQQQQHAKVDIPIEVFQQQYFSKITAVVDALKAMVAEKKQELIRLAELEKQNKDAAEKIREQKQKEQQEEKEKRDAALKFEEDNKRKEAAQLTEQKQLQLQLATQQKIQSVGPVSVKKSLLKATVTSPLAYRELAEFYIKQGGDISKLEFLADFAAKNGQPIIQGVNYNV